MILAIFALSPPLPAYVRKKIKYRHLGIIAQYLLGYMFATKACIHNRKKKTYQAAICPPHVFVVVNFGLLTAEIRWRVWGTPANFNGFRVWQRYCTPSSSGRQPNFAALNRGRHLCSAGRPSRWALAHISSIFML